MAEIGTVIGVKDDNRLLVRLERQEACAKCRACTAGMKKEEMILTAENLCGGKVGDNVEVTLEMADFMKAAMIMYGLPFAMFMIGIFAGYYISLNMGYGSNELIGFLTGLVLVCITYILIHSQEKRWKSNNYVPKAIKVVD
jgi:sigma-E factor negative regulatory protein RseC